MSKTQQWRCHLAQAVKPWSLAAIVCIAVSAVPQYTRSPFRSVSGPVTDGHEPLRGAVVQLEAEDTLAIQSYITDERGEYHFRNLNSDANYQVWASFRGHTSKKHEVSKFEKKLDVEIPLTIDLEK